MFPLHLPLLLVAQSSSVGRLAAPVRVHSQWWQKGFKVGRSQPRAGRVGRLSRAPNVTLSDFLPAKGDGKKVPSPAMSRRSSWVSWSGSPREQAVPSGNDAVMEDCTESHQSEINRKIKANNKLQKILTAMPKEHRELIYGDSFQSKMQSMDDEKAALLAAKRHFLPLQSQIEKQKNSGTQVERYEEEWTEADQELESANSKQVQAKHALETDSDTAQYWVSVG